MIHDDATRMELDSAIAYLVGHVVVVFGAEFDIIVLHSRSQISPGGLWRESRFMVSHVTLTYWHRLKHVERIGPSWTLLEQIETQIKPYWIICKILNMLTHIETHWKRFKIFWDIGLWAAHTLFPFSAQSVFILSDPPAKKCPRISGPVFVRKWLVRRRKRGRKSSLFSNRVLVPDSFFSGPGVVFGRCQVSFL